MQAQLVRTSILSGGNSTLGGPEMEKSWELLWRFTKASSGSSRFLLSPDIHVVCVRIGRGERQSRATWGRWSQPCGER